MRALLAVVLIAAVPILGVLPAAADDEPTGYQRVVDLTFPVSGGAFYVDTYDADRSGGARKHQATDLMADKLQHVHAAVGGEVCYITGVDEPMPGYGYMIEICGDDGLRYSYIHLNNDSPGTDDGAGGVEWAYAPDIEEGAEVERGQWIGYVGDSGNAESTGSHLHLSIEDPDLDDPRIAAEPYDPHKLNPFNSLEAAQERGDVPEPPADAPSREEAEDRAGDDEPDEDEDPSDDRDRPSPEPEESEQEPAPQEPEDEPRDPEPSEDTNDEQPETADIERRSGDNRVRTAIALSLARDEGSAGTVIVVPADSHAEALVSAPLAGLLDAPVLLAGAEGLDDEVIDEIDRLGAGNAYIVGDTDRLSSQIEADLQDAGVGNTARLAADDAFGLSTTLAREVLSYPQVNSFENVVLAVGQAEDASRSWPDALSASALAAGTQAPILLTGGDVLADPVADLLEDLEPEVVTVVGGTSAVSEAVAEAAAAASGGRVERLAGATRYGTSVAVAEAAVEAGLDADAVWVATGRSFPDALAAGPAAARMGAPLLLVDGEAVGGAPESEGWLADESARLDEAVVVGGTSAVSQDVARALARLLAD